MKHILTKDQKEFIKTKIDDLDLPIRIKLALKKHNFLIAEDILKINGYELLKIPNISHVSYKEIKELFLSNGLMIKEWRY